MNICKECKKLVGGPVDCQCEECDVCGEIKDFESIFSVNGSYVCDDCFEAALAGDVE